MIRILFGNKKFNFLMNQESFKEQKTKERECNAGDDIFVACLYSEGIYLFGRGRADK